MIHNDEMTSKTVDPTQNLARAYETLDAALVDASRAPGSVKVIAISKKHGCELIESALVGGHRYFGENRVQEAAQKWPLLKRKFDDIELHLVGPLQSNKAADAVALFDVIQTIDRPKIARAIADESTKQSRQPTVLIQVNTGMEAQKAGVSPEDADAFIRFCRLDCALNVDGVMCIPPATAAPAPHFALLEKIGTRNGLRQISMGMSSDYDIAAQLGATMVRLGTGIFGARPV